PRLSPLETRIVLIARSTLRRHDSPGIRDLFKSPQIISRDRSRTRVTRQAWLGKISQGGVRRQAFREMVWIELKGRDALFAQRALGLPTQCARLLPCFRGMRRYSQGCS